ncbi:MAG: sodium:proton antiporter [Candidatus Tectomicrobia bacterium]|nr:sodium:proton antiporter [Candidatus Tectomicrobia bacterium]
MRMPFGSPVLDAACRMLVPFVMLFAVYVVAHGHDSPGGGFQGGTILAAAIILIRLVHGQDAIWGLTRVGALRLACGGVGLFAGIGFLCLPFAGNYLDYGALPLPLETVTVRFVGTLGIEAGVAMAVTGVLVLIFDALTAWGEED